MTISSSFVILLFGSWETWNSCFFLRISQNWCNHSVKIRSQGLLESVNCLIFNKKSSHLETFLKTLQPILSKGTGWLVDTLCKDITAKQLQKSNIKTPGAEAMKTSRIFNSCHFPTWKEISYRKKNSIPFSFPGHSDYSRVIWSGNN